MSFLVGMMCGTQIMWMLGILLFALNLNLLNGSLDKYSCRKEFATIGKKDFHFRGTALGKSRNSAI
jgi:hypothetical protein